MPASQGLHADSPAGDGGRDGSRGAGLGRRDELAHDGDEGHLRQLAVLAESPVEGGQGRVVADRGDSGYMQHVAGLGASAPFVHTTATLVSPLLRGQRPGSSVARRPGGVARGQP